MGKTRIHRNRQGLPSSRTKVIIGDVDLGGAKDTVASIKDKGGEADGVDVTKSTDVQAMVTRAVAQYGGLDFAFNNAGLWVQ